MNNFGSFYPHYINFDPGKHYYFQNKNKMFIENLIRQWQKNLDAKRWHIQANEHKKNMPTHYYQELKKMKDRKKEKRFGL